MSDSDYFIRIGQASVKDKFNFATGGIETCWVSPEEVVLKTIDTLGLGETRVGQWVRLEVEEQHLRALHHTEAEASVAVTEQQALVNHLREALVSGRG